MSTIKAVHAVATVVEDDLRLAGFPSAVDLEFQETAVRPLDLPAIQSPNFHSPTRPRLGGDLLGDLVASLDGCRNEILIEDVVTTAVERPVVPHEPHRQ